MATKFVSSSQLQHFPTLVSAAGCKSLGRSYHLSTTKSFSICNTQQRFCNRRLVFSSLSNGRLLGNGGRLPRPFSATGSGVETSFTDPKDNAITVKDAKIVVESQDENSIQLRVDLAGGETETIFSKVLRNLALTAPPIPGFRRQKGGKTSKVPREFLIQVLGEDRVTNFVIQEIVSTTVAAYATKENLKVKENKVNTTQTAEELKKLFQPGKEFGFNATLELEQVAATETATENETATATETETATATATATETATATATETES